MTRSVRFVNVFNFRDVPRADGKLFRSSSLSTLDDVDRARYLELGVPDDEIAADYSLSTEFILRWQERHPGVPLAPSVLYTPAAAMLIFLARLRDRHGSVVGYLRHLGLPDSVPAGLRAKFLP